MLSRISAGEDTPARGHADRVLDEVLIENRSLNGQAIDIGSFNHSVAIYAKTISSHLIRSNQQNIRLFIHDCNWSVGVVEWCKALLLQCSSIP
jgi:hypothetical protein